MKTGKKEKKPDNMTYLRLLADRFVSERPSSDIIINTFTDIHARGYNRGYQTRLADGAKFKEWQTKRRTESWNGVKDHIDNLVHKSNIDNTNSKTE
jgi:hypothetical protein